MYYPLTDSIYLFGSFSSGTSGVNFDFTGITSDIRYSNADSRDMYFLKIDQLYQISNLGYDLIPMVGTLDIRIITDNGYNGNTPVLVEKK